MRVLMVTSHLGDAYGQERVLRASSAALRSLGHEVHFLCEKTVGPVPNADGVHVVSGLSLLDSFSAPSEAASLDRALFRLLTQIKPDLIHLIDVLDFRILDLFHSYGPTVLTAHTVAPTCPASTRMAINAACDQKSGWQCLSVDKKIHCLSQKNLLRKTHAIQNFLLKKRILLQLNGLGAISEYMAKVLIKDGFDPDRIYHIPNPISLPEEEPFTEEIPSKLILVASRLVALKGISVLMEALAKIKHKDWTVWVFGKGPMGFALEHEIARQGLLGRVFLKGYLPLPQLLSLYRHCNMLIQPNIGPEGFGLSAVEAASLGVPVILSSIPAFNEIFENEQNALLVPVGDPGQLAHAIQRLLEDGKLKGRLRNNSIAFKETYSLQRHLAATLRFYSAALEGNPLAERVSPFQISPMEMTR